MGSERSETSRTQVFLCYRRDDAAWPARVVYSHLADRFGADAVFRDTAVPDRLLPGSDFRRVIDAEITRSAVLLALMGDHWLTATLSEGVHAGQRRLDDPHDVVRVEIETALAWRVRVIPVLVGEHNAPPRYDELPAGPLRELASRHAAEVRPGPSAEADLNQLLSLVQRAREQPDVAWEPSRADGSTVRVTFRRYPGLPDDEMELHLGVVRTVGQLADEVWTAAQDRIAPYTYGTSWVLRNATTQRVVEHARLLHHLPPGEFVADTRSLDEVDVSAGDLLEVLRPEDLPQGSDAGGARRHVLGG